MQDRGSLGHRDLGGAGGGPLQGDRVEHAAQGRAGRQPVMADPVDDLDPRGRSRPDDPPDSRTAVTTCGASPAARWARRTSRLRIV